MNDIGIDLSVFDTAAEVLVTKTIPDVEHLKTFLDAGLCENGRQSRFDNLFGNIIPPTQEPQDQLIHQIQEYIFGNGKLSKPEMQQANALFPMDVAVIVAQSKDVSSEWNLTDPNVPIVKVELGTLNLKQGGYIVIHGQSLEFTVDTINRDGNSGSADYADFNILGVDGATPATAGTPTSPGTASKGTVANCNGGSAGTGHTGAPGSPGDPGAPGNKPTPSMAAEIIITTSIGGTANEISFLTRSGAGGKGGKGGKGAKGGTGGTGGDGARCTCTGRPGGTGGIGGTGGRGGKGGDGVNGVDAAGNIIINVPQSEYLKVATPLKKDAPPGERGTGGDGGERGDAGSGGKDVGKGSATGSPGQKGGEGTKGDYGNPGTQSGKPGNVNVIST